MSINIYDIQLKPRKGVTLITGFFAVSYSGQPRYSVGNYELLHTVAVKKTGSVFLRNIAL